MSHCEVLAFRHAPTVERLVNSPHEPGQTSIEEGNSALGVRVAFIFLSFAVAFGAAFSLLLPRIETQVWIQGYDWVHQPAMEIWFESDPPMVHDSLIDRTAEWQKPNRHPLFPFAGLFVVKLLCAAGIEESLAVCLTLAFGAGCASALMALNLLLMVRDKLLCLLMQALFLGSSSFLFWAGVCERFVIGSASILAVSAIAAISSSKRELNYGAAVAANVIAASITITNWMFGLFLSVCFYRPRRIYAALRDGFLIVTALWFLQGLVVTPNEHFLMLDRWNQLFIFNSYAGDISDKLRALVEHSIVIPKIHNHNFAVGDTIDATGLLGVQHSPSGSTGPVGLTLVIVWTFLLFVSSITWWRKREKTHFDRFILLGLAGQLLLHMVYGTELFLYGMHLAPLLILYVALGVNELRHFTRWAALAVLCLFVPALAWHNLSHLRTAEELFLERYQLNLQVDPAGANLPTHTSLPTIQAQDQK